jgi:hypothetical protein
MKIRIKGNFIRFRVSQTDVLQLAETGKVAETTCFGPGQVFGYALEAQAGISNLQATFDGSTIVLYLPVEAARSWHADARVGFENQVVVAPGITLNLLLEKDFTCLDTTAEDQSDNYPNPRKVTS